MQESEAVCIKKPGRFPFRYTILALLFLIVCVAFVARVVYLQITAPPPVDAPETFTRTLTVKAIRGEIYDRNGKKLVSNKYSYNVFLDAGNFPKTNKEINGTLLYLIDLLGDGINTQFPVTNGFDDAEYKEIDKNSSEYQGFMKMLDYYGLSRSTDVKTLLNFLADRYGIKDANGKFTVNKQDSLSLIALRYETERLQFSPKNPFTVQKNVSLSQITAIEEANIDGVEIEKVAERVYNYPGYASHILGRTGKIQAPDLEYYTEKGYAMDATVGVDGAEKLFEEYLRGIDGTMVIVEDKNGNIVNEYYEKEPVPGKDVYLTIDIDLQKTAEDALAYNIAFIKETADNKIREETLKQTDEKGNLIAGAKIPQYIGEDVTSGAAVLVNPNNGEVYALASNPTFDLSTFSQDYNTLLNTPNNPLFNRALMGTYEPGSTFKISMAAAALEYGVIDKNTKIFDSGVYRFYKDFQPECWVYTSHGYGHGNINVVTAIQHSCNYFFYEVGRVLTIERMNEYCRTLGLGEYTGIELPESKGILAGPEYSSSANKPWVPGDTIQAAIGQSDNTFTPLQVSMYLSTIINGGSRYQAHILHSVREYGTNKTIYETSPNVLNTIQLSDETLETLKIGMKNVMENGTAAPVFADYPLEIGGKTGTAQVGKTKSNNGIFMAFAPYDKPEVVATCIIEQAGGSNEVGITLRRMFNDYFDIVE